MIATDCTRDDCQLNRHRITYAKLQREYRCGECGGRAVVKPPGGDGGWHVECGRCGSRDFVHEIRYQRQQVEALEVLDGLPPELAAMMGSEREEREPELFPLHSEPIDI